MPVTVISKRVFKMEDREKLIPLLQSLRKDAKKQEGFIDRKTFSSLDNPGENIIISKWKTLEHWKKWTAKKKFRKIQGKIDSLIGEKTVYDVYQPEKY